MSDPNTSNSRLQRSGKDPSSQPLPSVPNTTAHNAQRRAARESGVTSQVLEAAQNFLQAQQAAAAVTLAGPSSQTTTRSKKPQAQLRSKRTTPRQVARRKAPPPRCRALEPDPTSTPVQTTAKRQRLSPSNPRSYLGPAPPPPSADRIEQENTANLPPKYHDHTAVRGAWLPPLELILTGYTPIIKHIPIRFRAELGRTLSSVLWDCAKAATSSAADRAYGRLTLLPSAILLSIPSRNSPARTNANGGMKSTMQILRDRLRRWNTGDTESLWQDICDKRKALNRKKHQQRDTHAHTSLPHSLKRAKALAHDGSLAKAIRALQSGGTHSPSPQTYRALLSKHPQSVHPNEGRIDLTPNVPPPTTPPPITSVTPEEVKMAIRRMGRAASGGGSGLSPTHLLDLLSCPDSTDDSGLYAALAAVCTSLLRGQGPKASAKWFCGAPLTALVKPDGGVRPIAVGETIRRLTASISLHRIRDDVPTILGLQQRGVACRNGAESIIHTVRKLTEQHGSSPDYGCLQIDLKNAFNCVNRDIIIRETARHFPTILPWVRYCYANRDDPVLWLGEKYQIPSHTGVQQGDPLGPLLFTLALRPVLARLSQLSPIPDDSDNHDDDPHHILFYMDDGVLIGTHTFLQQALTYLGSEEVRAHGLHLRVDKCRLWWPTQNANTNYPTELKQDDSDGTFILGAPVGSTTFMNDAMKRIGREKAKLLDSLDDLQDAHVSFSLLRACFGACRLNYLLRTVPPSSSAEAAAQYDEATHRVLRKLAGGTIHHDALHELMLPVRIGDPTKPHFGVGLTPATRAAAPAYLASRFATEKIVEQTIGENAEALALKNDTNAKHALQSLTTQLHLAEPPISLHEPPQDGEKTSQSALTQLLVDKEIDTIYNDDTPPQTAHTPEAALRLREQERTKAFRQSLSLPGSKDWLRCPPSPGLGTHIPNRAFRIWFAFYARSPIFNRPRRPQQVLHCTRPKCTQTMDVFGDHLLHCGASTRASYAPTIRRHDKLVRLLANDLLNAAKSPRIEPRQRRGTELLSHPDIIAISPTGGDEVLDVSVTHDFGTARHRQRNTATCPLSTLRRKYVQKISQHRHYIEQEPSTRRTIPILYAASGGWYPHTHQYMTELAAVIADRTETALPVAKARIFQRHAACLITANARCLLSGNDCSLDHAIDHAIDLETTQHLPPQLNAQAQGVLQPTDSSCNRSLD